MGSERSFRPLCRAGQGTSRISSSSRKPPPPRPRSTHCDGHQGQDLALRPDRRSQLLRGRSSVGRAADALCACPHGRNADDAHDVCLTPGCSKQQVGPGSQRAQPGPWHSVPARQMLAVTPGHGWAALIILLPESASVGLSPPSICLVPVPAAAQNRLALLPT